jgi:hypothetical protein
VGTDSTTQGQVGVGTRCQGGADGNCSWCGLAAVGHPTQEAGCGGPAGRRYTHRAEVNFLPCPSCYCMRSTGVIRMSLFFLQKRDTPVLITPPHSETGDRAPSADRHGPVYELKGGLIQGEYVAAEAQRGDAF